MTLHFYSLTVGRWALDVGRFLLLRSAFGIRRLPQVSSLGVGRWALGVECCHLLCSIFGVRRSVFDVRCFLL